MKILSTIVPYLLLVTFSTGNLSDFDNSKVCALNDSPYHGVAMALTGAYSTNYRLYSDYEKSARALKKNTKKDVWPWLFFNRFIGSKVGDKSNSEQSKKKYFQKIKGIDIENEVGALHYFYGLFGTSLRICRENKWPGVVIDPEAYNNYKNYNVNYVAHQLGSTRKETIKKLKDIGSELAYIAEKEYPNAVLWFLFTRLSENEKINYDNESVKDFSSISYIIIGLLEELEKIQSSIKVYCGGETFLGYCNIDLSHLKKKIVTRKIRYSEFMPKYQNFSLAGTISPWSSPEYKKGWMLNNVCGNSKLQNIDDFIPLFSNLVEAYGNVWIYAASDAGYNPYDKDVSAKFNESLKKSISLQKTLAVEQ